MRCVPKGPAPWDHSFQPIDSPHAGFSPALSSCIHPCCIWRDHFEKSLIYVQDKPMLFILAQLCWLLFPQALRWLLLSPGGRVFQADPIPPRVSRLHGLFHAPCPAVCRHHNPPMIHTWASLTPLWAGPCRFFSCPSSSQRFSSSPSVSFHSEMTLVCVMKKLISQVISPQCLLHIFLLFFILLCVAETFLSSLPPHQNIDLRIC